MRPTSWILAPLLLTLGVAASGQEREPRTIDGPPKVVKETVRSSNGPWTRLTGRVAVVNAYTLRFADGTAVDLRFAMDAPEPAQQGVIGGAPYPCGQEAAAFLAKLI